MPNINVNADQSLAEVVGALPDAARVLESFGLDYCCGGRRSVDDACADAGVDAGTVLEALAHVQPGPDPAWASMNPVELVNHIEATHHAYLHSELERLEVLAEKLADHHGDRHPELVEVRAVYGTLRADLKPHLLKEERVLFPMIRDLATSVDAPILHCGSVRNPISVMMLEHETTGQLLAMLRALTDGYEAPSDGCASYRAFYHGLAQLEADTHLHIFKENHLLFPAVVALEQASATQR